MDWSLIIFIAVIGFFAWRGYRRGFINSLGRICAVLAGYAAAIPFSGPLSIWVELQIGWPLVVCFIVASLTLFLGAGIGVMLIFALLRRVVFRGDDISTVSALGGGFVGAAVGSLLAVVIVWSFAFARDMQQFEAAETTHTERASGVETLVNRLAGDAVSAAMEAGSATPEVARLSGLLMADPAEVTQRTQRLMTSAEFQTLVHDPRNQQILDSGDPERVQRLPAFRTLAANPDLLALAGMAGFVESDDLEAGLARYLTDVWGRAQRVKDNPEVQTILADPEFRATLDEGNLIAIITNRKFLEIADIVFADDATAANQAFAGEPEANASKDPSEVYHWTDASGRIHYSDQKPAN